MILLLLFVLILLLLWVSKSFNKDYSSPSFLYLLGFVASVFAASLYRNEWGLNEMRIDTIAIIIGGGLLFFLTEFFCRKKYPFVINDALSRDDFVMPLKLNGLIIILAIQVITYMLLANYRISSVGVGTLSDALAEIDSESKNEGIAAVIPQYLYYMNLFSTRSGFVMAIVFPYSMISMNANFRLKLLSGLNLLVALAGALLSGSRGGVMELLISTFVFLYIFNRSKNYGKTRQMTLKVKVYIIAAIISFAALFSQLGSWVGRDTSDDFTPDYLVAFYLGGQVKNLDIDLDSPQMLEYYRYNKYFGENTLNQAYNSLGRYVGVNIERSEAARAPFNSYNGYFLGNVATAYYTYILDFGYYGVLCVIIICLVTYWLYSKTMTSNFFINGRLNLWMIVFSWIICTVFLTFFGEQFYRRLTIDAFVKSLFMWYVAILLLQGYNNKLKY